MFVEEYFLIRWDSGRSILHDILLRHIYSRMIYFLFSLLCSKLLLFINPFALRASNYMKAPYCDCKLDSLLSDCILYVVLKYIYFNKIEKLGAARRLVYCYSITQRPRIKWVKWREWCPYSQMSLLFSAVTLLTNSRMWKGRRAGTLKFTTYKTYIYIYTQLVPVTKEWKPSGGRCLSR